GVGQLELALQHYELGTGYGTEYPADVAQNYAYWIEYQSSALMSYEHQITDSFSAKAQLRYRETGVDRDSDFLEGYNIATDNGETVRVVDFSYWQVDNHSNSVTLDVSYEPDDQPWLVNAGVKYENK